jgi:hypothetical protein
MIWFFIITSALLALIGVTFLVAPQKMLFLMPDAETQRLMGGRFYLAIARVGGILMLFVCAPLNLIVGLFLVGVVLTTQ